MSFARRILSSAVLLAAAAGPAAAQAFEGVVTVTLGGGATAATVYAKGGRARYEMNAAGREMAMLIDSSGTVTMLMPAQKRYMVMTNMAAQAKMQAAGAPFEFKKAGKQASYAGYACELYTMGRAGAEPSQACITSELGSLGADLGTASGTGLLSADDLKRLRAEVGNNFFVLWMAGADGKVLYEVTKVEKTPVPDERLQVPAGYTEMKSPGQQ